MKPKRVWRYHVHRLSRLRASRHSISLGFAAGVFASFTPFVGFHFLLAALLAWIARGNLIASAVGTVAGNPITFPAIWVATYNLGAALVGVQSRTEVDMPGVQLSQLWQRGADSFLQTLWTKLEPVVWPMIVGSIPLGMVFAVISYWIVLLALQKSSYVRSRHQISLER